MIKVWDVYIQRKRATQTGCGKMVKNKLYRLLKFLVLGFVD
jgi:hypothetical protein